MTDPQPPAIDAGLVARLVAGQFPRWSGLPVRPVEVQGVDNRTFRLGDELAVRLPSAAHYREQVAKEQRWLPRLAPHLPVPIPAPVAVGAPGLGYPWSWSVNRWLPGTTAAAAAVGGSAAFARDVAGFLRALWSADAGGGPPPGTHNFRRGAPVTVYEAETLRALDSLAGRVDVAAARKVWDAAVASTWTGAPAWFHGDCAPGNLLVDDDGRLSAVIDFGTCGVGDPACDLVLSWTFLDGPARSAFRAAMGPIADDGMWARARGWALWKALITYDSDGPRWRAEARRTLDAVLADA
ncbi:aminoglycoside phosphotransferase family protein [Jiangella mangrovi]|uniref:Aminoglycoside phosphotransferase (APT) family kinase protein n=1 Tax=Jiangella mangrovi TaxID=1524084 RepID=A0A7W9LNC8_9ACTN|nr:aminoglycoside phosphotransferase family protein [Jiangella mangrovi]MBB5790166.1 aminoglycoside phosphotransferase (APT) family kinase protein [Jiangella mangrovi]